MLSTIHIPQPCHENWEAMTPAAQGRHCAVCCKTVIDFTGWEVTAIADYLAQNAENRTCGRFTTDQLQQDYFVPETYLYNVLTSGLHYMKQIAAIVLFVFVLSSTADAQSKQQHQPQKDYPVMQGAVAAPPPQRLAGAPVAIPQHTVPDTTKRPVKGKVIQHPVMGRIRMEPKKK